MVVVAILLLLGIIMYSTMHRFDVVFLTAIIINVVMTSIILINQNILTGMIAIVLGIDLLDICFRSRTMIILLSVVVGIMILILDALDVVKDILIVLWAQRLAVFIVEEHQDPVQVMFTIAIDIEKATDIVFEFLLYQYWIEIFLVISSNA